MLGFPGVGRPGHQTHLFCFNDDLMIALDLLSFLPGSSSRPHFLPSLEAFSSHKELSFHPYYCQSPLHGGGKCRAPPSLHPPALRPPCHQTQCLNLTMGGVVAFKSRSCFLLYFLQHLNKCLPRRSGHKQTNKKY